MLKSNSVTDLFFGKGYINFGNVKYFPATDDLNIKLLDKLRKVLFFQTLEVEVLPSYRFGTLVSWYITSLPAGYFPIDIEQESRRFVASEVDYLKNHLHMVLLCLKNLPQILIDLYTFYPRFNLKFEEIEFIYLDFGSETPKVIDSLLNELLLRDAPIREPFKTQWSDDPTESGLPSDVVDPGIRDDDYSKEEHRRQKRGYFLDLGRFPVFVDIITEYLKARPVLLQELITSLVDSNLDTSDERLAHLFVENMLKDVSKETLEFLEANLKIFIYKDPKIGATQDPFIYQRVMGDIEGEEMTVARRTWLLKCSRENLETTRKRVAMRYQEEVGLVKVEEPEVLVEDIRNYPKEIPIPDLFSKETRKEE